MTEAMSIQIKRIYDAPDGADGFRVLVDRLWPRGIAKRDARIDLWAKELAPTAELRKWFGHDESKFGEFRLRYLRELDEKRSAMQGLLQDADGRTVTLPVCRPGAVLQSCRGSAGAIVRELSRFGFATQAVQLLRSALFSSTLSPSAPRAFTVTRRYSAAVFANGVIVKMR